MNKTMNRPIKKIEIDVKMRPDVGAIELAAVGEAIKTYIYNTYLDSVDDVTVDIVEVKSKMTRWCGTEDVG